MELINDLMQDIVIFNNICGKARWKKDSPEEYQRESFYLRMKLLREEYDELKDSIENKDVVEIIDALCDILVIFTGGWHEMIDFYVSDNDFESLEKATLEDTNVLKFINDNVNLEELFDQYDKMKESNEDVLSLIQTYIKKYYLYERAFMKLNFLIPKYNLLENLDRINKSNLDKFPTTEREALATMDKYAKDNISTFFEYKEKEKVYVVYREDLKVLKRAGWKKHTIKVGV